MGGGGGGGGGGEEEECVCVCQNANNNGKSYTCKMASLYWNGPSVSVIASLGAGTEKVIVKEWIVAVLLPGFAINW